MYEKSPIEECFEKTHNIRDRQNVNVISRLVAKKINTSKDEVHSRQRRHLTLRGCYSQRRSLRTSPRRSTT